MFDEPPVASELRMEAQGAGSTPVCDGARHEWHAREPVAGRAARAAQQRTYWVGYTIPPVKTLPPFVHIDGHNTVMGDGMTFGGELLSSDAQLVAPDACSLFRPQISRR